MTLMWVALPKNPVDSRMLGYIQRNTMGSPSRLNELAYLTLVRSLEIDRLKKIQRRAARFNNYRRECGLTSIQLIDKPSWASLQERRKTARLFMLYKSIIREVALLIGMLRRPDTRTRGSTQNVRPIQSKRDRFKALSSFIGIYRIGINYHLM